MPVSAWLSKSKKRKINDNIVPLRAVLTSTPGKEKEKICIKSADFFANNKAFQHKTQMNLHFPTEILVCFKYF